MLRLVLSALILLSPSLGAAKSIFLNGVPIDGVTNQTFNNCTVTIDAQGNILITAKGYAVGSPGATAAAQAQSQTPASAPATMTQRYWLVTEKAAPGMAQYDIELFVNSKYVRKFLDREEQVYFELTKYLKPGINKLVFVAKKNLAEGRRSSSPQHYFRIVVGEGDSGGRNIMISRKLVDYKRTALETKDFKDEFTITTR